MEDIDSANNPGIGIVDESQKMQTRHRYSKQVTEDVNGRCR